MPRPKKAPCCPECKGELRGIDPTPNAMAVCPRCAAIMLCDAGIFRALLTEEWWPIRTRPEWYDLCERRMQTLETITAPETSTGGVRPWGTRASGGEVE